MSNVVEPQDSSLEAACRALISESYMGEGGLVCPSLIPHVRAIERVLDRRRQTEHGGPRYLVVGRSAEDDFYFLLTEQQWQNVDPYDPWAYVGPSDVSSFRSMSELLEHVRNSGFHLVDGTTCDVY